MDFMDTIIEHLEKFNRLVESTHFDLIFGAIINLLLIAVLFKAVDMMGEKLKNHIITKDGNSQLTQFVPILDKILKFLIVFFIVASFLQSHGYSVSSLITGFGITGLAVGFAANATISNIFGTLAIFSDKAYKIGDYIIANGVEGTVEDVNIRSTKIRTIDNFLYIVPNSSVATGNICNVSRAKKRRIVEVFTLTYDTSDEMLERAIKIVEEILGSNKDIHSDYVVFLDTLADSSINIKCIAYAKTKSYNELMKIKSGVILEVVKRFRAEGLDFAFPSTSVYVEKSGN